MLGICMVLYWAVLYLCSVVSGDSDAGDAIITVMIGVALIRSSTVLYHTESDRIDKTSIHHQHQNERMTTDDESLPSTRSIVAISLGAMARVDTIISPWEPLSVVCASLFPVSRLSRASSHSASHVTYSSHASGHPASQTGAFQQCRVK